MTPSPIIIALDVETAVEARAIVHALGNQNSFYKVGLELYAAAGMDFVRELKAQGHRVFLDLKLHDIGETVRRTVVQVARVGVDFLTIHAMSTVMRAAVRGLAEVDSKIEDGLTLLAVTVLTDLDDHDLKSDGYASSASDLVALRARNAMDAGVRGLVCSPREVAAVRKITGPRAILVTPGVRSVGSAAGDQKRVATPAEAIANGADYLVIGRQVTRAPDPPAELHRILEEISSAMNPSRVTPSAL